MNKRTDALPADRAFVVQFRAAPGSEPLANLSGRVEHIRSGAARHFESLDELLRFLERSLASPPEKAKAAEAGSE